jgi:hypothetical protein
MICIPDTPTPTIPARESDGLRSQPMIFSVSPTSGDGGHAHGTSTNRAPRFEDFRVRVSEG